MYHKRGTEDCGIEHLERSSSSRLTLLETCHRSNFHLKRKRYGEIIRMNRREVLTGSIFFLGSSNFPGEASAATTTKTYQGSIYSGLHAIHGQYGADPQITRGVMLLQRYSTGSTTRDGVYTVCAYRYRWRTKRTDPGTEYTFVTAQTSGSLCTGRLFRPGTQFAASPGGGGKLPSIVGSNPASYYYYVRPHPHIFVTFIDADNLLVSSRVTLTGPYPYEFKWKRIATNGKALVTL